MQRKWQDRVVAVLLGVLAAACLCVGSAAAKTGDYTSVAELNDPSVTVGVNTGSISELTVAAELPRANMAYYDDKFLGYEDVATGKIDAFVYDQLQMELAIENGLSHVRLLDELIGQPVSIAVGLSEVSKIPNLQEKVNEFIALKHADGTLDDMHMRWLVEQNESIPPIEPPANPTGVITIATTGDVPPYSFYKGTELCGYDIELAMRFAQWMGMRLNLVVYDWGGIVPAAQTGKIDCIMSNLQVSEERLENLLFSDTLFVERQGVLVYSAEKGGGTGTTSNQTSVWDKVAKSIEQTFVVEDRWRLFVKGLETTLLITVLSVLAGTVLGFVLFALCSLGGSLADRLTRIATGLVRGMPTVVFLMFLYYVVFRNAEIGGVAVAVVAFTIIFGASVLAILRMGVGAVDRGQFEAAYALGHTKRQTFNRVILPQAFPHMLPAYQGEIVGLLKSTAIVGYIAVQDLTKMSDIVRSRTYEAFVPLIAITIIYFACEGIIALLIQRVGMGVNPKLRRHKRLLAGVKTDD